MYSSRVLDVTVYLDGSSNEGSEVAILITSFRTWSATILTERQSLTIRFAMEVVTLADVCLLTRRMQWSSVGCCTLLVGLLVESVMCFAFKLYFPSRNHFILCGWFPMPWNHLGSLFMTQSSHGEITHWSQFCYSHCLNATVNKPYLATSIKSPDSKSVTIPLKENHKAEDV